MKASLLLKPYFWLYLVGFSMIAYYGYKWGSQIVHAHQVKPVASMSKQIIKFPKKELTISDLYPKALKTGESIGTLSIPKINESLRIVHGTDEDELAQGVGHYAGSVLPGEPDLCVLAGHRDTVFRHLGEVGVGDQLIVNTVAGSFTYRVKETKIVDQNDRSVIHSTYPKAELLVSTCYPFDFIGPAPKRFLLIADLEKQQLNVH